MSEDRISENGATSDSRPEESGEERETLRLGGMALRNGLLIHGPTHWAAAARDAIRRDRGRLGAEARRWPRTWPRGSRCSGARSGSPRRSS